MSNNAQQGATPQTAALATTKPKDPAVQAMQDITGLFTRATDRIKAIAPRHITAERMIRVLTTAISRNPDLMKATHPSLLNALMTASELGLEPNTPLQLAYLIPYWNSNMNAYEAQFMPSYRGLMQLARQSGMVKAIYAFAVYEGDLFEYELGLHPQLKHIPAEMVDDDDDDDASSRAARAEKATKRNLSHVYCVTHFVDTDPTFTVMRRDQVDRIRARSRAKSGPWTTDYDEMAIKTVVRKHCKQTPASAEKSELLAKALELQAKLEMGEPVAAQIATGAEKEKADAQVLAALSAAPKDVGGDAGGQQPTATATPAAEPTPPPAASQTAQQARAAAREARKKQKEAAAAAPPPAAQQASAPGGAGSEGSADRKQAATAISNDPGGHPPAPSSPAAAPKVTSDADATTATDAKVQTPPLKTVDPITALGAPDANVHPGDNLFNAITSLEKDGASAEVYERFRIAMLEGDGPWAKQWKQLDEDGQQEIIAAWSAASKATEKK